MTTLHAGGVDGDPPAQVILEGLVHGLADLTCNRGTRMYTVYDTYVHGI